jgi:hypothetical protein
MRLSQLGLFFHFALLHFGSFPGGVYAVSPLMHEVAGFVRKIGGFGVVDGCKWWRGKEIKNFGKLGGSRIAPTGFVRVLGGEKETMEVY